MTTDVEIMLDTPTTDKQLFTVLDNVLYPLCKGAPPKRWLAKPENAITFVYRAMKYRGATARQLKRYMAALGIKINCVFCADKPRPHHE